MTGIQPTPNPMFQTADSLTSAYQVILASTGVPHHELYPLIMLYHNTLLKEVNHGNLPSVVRPS